MSQKKRKSKKKSAVNKPYHKQSVKQVQLTRKIEAALAKTKAPQPKAPAQPKAPKPKAPKPKAPTRPTAPKPTAPKPKAPKIKAPTTVNLMATAESIGARVDAAIKQNDKELKMLYELRDKARSFEEREIFQSLINRRGYRAVRKRKIRGAQAINLVAVEEAMPTPGFGNRETKHHYTREE